MSEVNGPAIAAVTGDLIAERNRLRAAVGAALDTLDGAGCVFWACEGVDPDGEPEDMITCRVCWAIHDLRRALADPGPTQRPDTDTKETP